MMYQLLLEIKPIFFSSQVNQFIVGDLFNKPDFSSILEGVDCIVHLAGKAHLTDQSKFLLLDEFRQINTDLTIHLARSKLKR